MAQEEWNITIVLLLVVTLAQLQPSSMLDEDFTSVPRQFPRQLQNAELTFPVPYTFYGKGTKICLILTPSTTAVIEAPDLGTGLNYSVSAAAFDLPIDLEQSQRFPCMILSGNCTVLVVSTQSTGLIQESFLAFLGDNQTTVTIGPLGLSTLDGSTSVTLSGPNSGFSLIIRALESVDDLLIIFCKDGVRLAGFNSRQRRPQQDCRPGSIGGFSVPFEYLITYEGSPSLLLGQQINATTAATCEDPASRYFLLLDVQPLMSTTAVTLEPTPSTSSNLPLPSSTMFSSVPVTSLITTPTPGPSFLHLVIGVGVGVVGLLLVCMCGIAIVVMCVVYIRNNNFHQKLKRHQSVQERSEDSIDLVVDPTAQHITGVVENGGTGSHSEKTVEAESSFCHENSHADLATTDASNIDSPAEATPTVTESSVKDGDGLPSRETASEVSLPVVALDTDLPGETSSIEIMVGKDGHDGNLDPSVKVSGNEPLQMVESSTSVFWQSPQASSDEDVMEVDVEASLLPSITFKRKTSISFAGKNLYSRQSSRNSQEGKDKYLDSANEGHKEKKRSERGSSSGSLPSNKELMKMIHKTQELVKQQGNDMRSTLDIINKNTSATHHNVNDIKKRGEEEYDEKMKDILSSDQEELDEDYNGSGSNQTV